MIEHLFARIPVADRDTAIRWYEDLLGGPPEMLPNDREAAWQLTETAWLYLETDPAHAGSSLHTILVDDLDRFSAGIKERGIEGSAVEKVGETGRFTIISDPDGNRIKVAQVA